VSAALLFYALKWYNCVVMKMTVPKISDNFQRTEGCKMISPHHSHPTNGGPSDSLSALKASGKIRRVAPDKGGYWEVVG
jgi:hypothetical protein